MTKKPKERKENHLSHCTLPEVVSVNLVGSGVDIKGFKDLGVPVSEESSIVLPRKIDMV